MQTGYDSKKAQDAKLHFLDYWRIIRIRKTVILTVFLLVVLTTTGVTFFLKEIFASTARISIKKDNYDISPVLELQPAMQFDPYWIQTEFERIQSRSVLHPVLVALELDKDLAKRYKVNSVTTNETYLWLKDSVNLKQHRNTSIIEITVYNENRERAAEIANKIAEVYRDRREAHLTNISLKGVKALEEELVMQTQSITNQQHQVDTLRSNLGVPDISAPEGQPMTATPGPQIISKLKQERTDAEVSHINYKALHDSIAALSDAEFRQSAPNTMPGNPRLANLIAKYDSVVQEIASYTTHTGGPENPNTVTLEEQKKLLNNLIEEEIEGIRLAVKQSVDKYEKILTALDVTIKKAEEKESRDTGRFRPYFVAKRKLESLQRFREIIRLRILQERAKVNLPKTSIVEFLDEAEAAVKPVRPNFSLNIALGILIGLVVGVGLAFFIEYLDTSVKTIDDVEQALGAPVLGVIPQNVSSLLEEGPDSPHAEAYRVLRTNVLFSRKSDDITTITVVSGGAGEGKSTTIFNLATVFAQNNNKVLVVDSDLRRPSLHKIIGVSNANGLTSYLMNNARLDEVIQTTSLSTLDFLPSGKLPSSSLGILNSAQMKTFVRDVKNRYDFVFFDSPPIMGVSDASILASEVDMSLLVIQYRKYPQAMTIRAKQMVENVGGNLLGVVLNNINISQDSYYYYYSGYYYDYYTKSDSSDSVKKDDKNGNPKTGKTAGRQKLDLKKKY